MKERESKCSRGRDSERTKNLEDKMFIPEAKILN